MSQNRTINDSGVQLENLPHDLAPITGTGVTPAQAAALAAPLTAFIASLPYELDERGILAYRTNTLALSHPAYLTYGPGHPLAGQPINAGWNDGDYITKHGGAPMPFIDMDRMPVDVLNKLLKTLQNMAVTVASAT
jgi:hypothetical protein